MTRRELGVAGAVLVVAFALSGCVTVGAPKPGLSDAEREEFVRAQLDVSWEYFGLAPELRPPDGSIVLVSREEYPGEFAACMNDAGFDNYLADGTIVFSEGSVQSDAELMANFDCGIRIVVPADESGLLNRAEREYAYDYYEQFLVPCLMKHSIAMYEPPSREEFHESFGAWNPYSSVQEKDRERALTDEQLRADCLPVAPGMTNYLYYGYYG